MKDLETFIIIEYMYSYLLQWSVMFACNIPKRHTSTEIMCIANCEIFWKAILKGYFYAMVFNKF